MDFNCTSLTGIRIFFIKIVRKLVEQLLRKTKIVCMSIGNHSKWEEGLVLNEFLIQEKKNFVGDLHNLVLIHCKI